MGIFAVLSSDSSPKFTVERAHLNLWCLPGLLGRLTVTVDVGLHLIACPAAPAQPGAAGVGAAAPAADPGARKLTFEMLLPFDTQENFFKDLSVRCVADTTRHLIFGAQAGNQNDSIEYDRQPVRVVAVDAKFLEFLPKTGKKTLAKWQLIVDYPINAPHGVYVRLRFATRNSSRVLQMQYSALSLAKTGVLVDCRVNDIRGLAEYSDIKGIEKELLPIADCRVFLIAPAEYSLDQSSPWIHYARVFEARNWNDYLGRATSLFGGRKFLVYSWTANDGTPRATTVCTPLRIFARFRRDTFTLISIAAARTMLISLIYVTLLVWFVAADCNIHSMWNQISSTWHRMAILATPFLPFLPILRKLKPLEALVPRKLDGLVQKGEYNLFKLAKSWQSS